MFMTGKIYIINKSSVINMQKECPLERAQSWDSYQCQQD